MKQVLIEGWRGINHSYAMVNHYQLAEMAVLPGFSIVHRDLPFARPNWNTTNNNPGFPEDFVQRYSGIPSGGEGEYDCVYRIAWPYTKTEARARRVLTFMTSEYGINVQSYPDPGEPVSNFSSGENAIVVPSNWSKGHFVDFGFPADRVIVVPHGVHPDFMRPLESHERAFIRTNMGFSADDFVFLNVGAMSWNKGLDVLLKAFCIVKKQHPQAHLVLKDDRQLYGVGAQEVLNELLAENAGLFDEKTLSAIKVLSATLTMDIMRNLYATADTYVSAYRAEGFNLPVIEALACGTPVVVTEGGPTDDFCAPEMSLKVASMRVMNEQRGIPIPGYHLEPSLDSLVTAMSQAICHPVPPETKRVARATLVEQHSWAACVRQLATHF